MKKMISAGAVLSLLAPYAVASGGGLQVGAVFGVAQEAAENGAPVEAVLRGVFELPKATGAAWTLGQKLYWHTANKNLTTSATGAILVGAAAEAATSGAEVGVAYITGQVA